MENILITGKIASSYQLIGAVAAKYKVSWKSKKKVYLKLTYYQYWKSVNVPKELLNFITRTQISEKKGYVINLEVNYSKNIFRNNKIIIDDGVGAYRRNIFEIIKVYNRELLISGSSKLNLKNTVKTFLKSIRNILSSMIYRDHISIFKKSFFNYFEPSKENIPFFIDAISELSGCFSNLEKFSNNTVIFIGQPWTSLGFKTDHCYFLFLKRIRFIIENKFPNKTLRIKKHPVDTFDYEAKGFDVIYDNCPIEILLFKNRGSVTSIVGFSSTSLLSCKVLFGVSAFYIIPPAKKHITNDFWINKAFYRHAKELSIK